MGKLNTQYVRIPRGAGKRKTKIYCSSEDDFIAIKKSVDFMGPIFMAVAEDMIKNDLLSVLVAEVHCSLKSDPYYITLTKDELESTLNSLETFYLNKEDYEECAKISKMKNLLKDKNEKSSELSGLVE